MANEKKAGVSQRDQTDASLRIERQKVDDVLDDKLSTLELAADSVIEMARARADAVLAATRAKVDQRREAGGDDRLRSLALERGIEDEVVRGERAEADEVRRLERAEHAAILDVERRDTNKDLSRERSTSDAALATRDEFLGTVSHDLRNMLGAVVGFAALIEEAQLRDAAHLSEEVLIYARRIQRSGGRMNRLIGDLVDVASIEAGRLAVTRRPADAREVVMEAVETFLPQAAASGVSLVAEVPPSSFVAAFDAARILQVLVNLLSNAIKFTPSGGRVTVFLEHTADELRFAVEDSGVGIEAAHLDAVFERFRQLDTNDRRGAGLGLYISRCIVQGHGGRVWVESRVGKGSTFRFTLPLVTPD